MPRTQALKPKKIVYLFGAGATQAEAEHVGAYPGNLLMADNERLGEGVARRVLNRAASRFRFFSPEGKNVDIEKLISLLAASAITQHTDLAKLMRRLYFNELRKSLTEAKVIAEPPLAIALLHMHKNTRFRRSTEILTGILTTNHDGLLQIASQKVYGALNLSFHFTSADFTATTSTAVPLILQLHGSFTWSFAVPVAVAKLRSGSKYLPDTLWLPPTILKETKNYPFNRLTGVAYALLTDRCDVLRVVGSSLTQNDWNIISLIFNAQRHRQVVKRVPFKVELIMPQAKGEHIQNECSYFTGLTPIGYLTEGLFDPYKQDSSTHDPAMANVFGYWLKEKITYHLRKGDFGRIDPTGPLAEISGEI